MSKKNEQTVMQPEEKALKKTPAQVEVLELDEAMLDFVNGGKVDGSDSNGGNCTNSGICTS